MAEASSSRAPPTPRQSGSSSSARRREAPSAGPDAPPGVAWRLVYDPTTDPSPTKKDAAPVYRLAGEGVDSVSDPRPKPGSSAFADVQARARSHRHRATVYKLPAWEHDSNSIGPAPPPPATGITITRLSTLVTNELLARHFSAYGRIAEVKLHTNPKNGGSLGICWIKFVDEKPTSGTGSSRDLALAKAGQDGHRVAKEAVARSHGAKLGLTAMSIRLDGDGSIARAAVRHHLDLIAKEAKSKASAAVSDVGSPALSNAATPRPHSYAGTPKPTPKPTPPIAPPPMPLDRRPPSPPVGFGVPRSSGSSRWQPPPPSRALWSERTDEPITDRPQLRAPLRLRNHGHRRSPSPPSDDDDAPRRFERRDELFDRRSRGRDTPRTPTGPAADARELRLSVQRRLSENGYPHISFSMAPLAAGRHEREISADDLRAHFAAVRIADVFNDGSSWFVTFASADGARKCHMVMDRKPLRGIALALSVHESPVRGAPIAGPSASPGKRSTGRPSPPNGWSDAELLREARELIVQELRQTVERDIRTRIVDVKIREAIGKRPRKATDNAVAAVKPEPADGMDVDASATTTQVNPTIKLPSFNKRRLAHRAPSLTPTTTTDVISVRSSESPPPPPPVELEPAPTSRPVKMVPRRKHNIDFSSSESEAEDEVVEAKVEAVSEEADMDIESSEPETVKPPPRAPKKGGGRKGAKKGKAKAVVKAASSEDEAKVARRGLASDEDEGTPSTLPTPVPDEIVVNGKLSKSVSPMQRAPTPDPFDPQLAVADDDEDLYYVRLALDRLRTGDATDLHPDPADAPENAPDQAHMTGSARTEGYYKIPTASKSAYMPLRNKLVEPTTDKAATSAVVSRLARATTRRLVTGIEQAKKTIASDAEIGQFNQLRTRKKQLKFARSPIHDWGLYALETIGAGEMIIEYVGELIRQPVADRREKAYDRQGMGSSYLFRVDEEWVVDASKKGSISRLINHCCTPNSIARIVSIQGSKRIVIYAKDQIEPGDEILYDYKFARETDQSLRIPCLCGSAGCRGYLN